MSRCQTCYETDDPNGYCACSRKAAADDWVENDAQNELAELRGRVEALEAQMKRLALALLAGGE